jgi:hypothetical protein
MRQTVLAIMRSSLARIARIATRLTAANAPIYFLAR